MIMMIMRIMRMMQMMALVPKPRLGDIPRHNQPASCPAKD